MERKAFVLDMLIRNWWALALRGVFAILFGLMAIVWPGLTLAALILLFGAYALVDGVFAVVHGVSSYGERERWWVTVLEGIAGIIIGIVTFLWPDLTALTLLTIIGVWAIFTGVMEIMGAIQLRQVIEGEWLYILSGIASVVFGALVILFPGAGALSLTWLIGTYALVFGVMFIILAFRLRGMKKEAETRNSGRPSVA